MDETIPIRPEPLPKDEILIVDDNVANLQLLSAILSEKGYAVRSAANGTLALQAVETAVPDIILLDIDMPDMNGYKVCKRIKAQEASRDVPVIFLSALGETLDKVEAFSIGGSDYISKPFEIEEVLARIENQLARGRLQKELQQANDELEQRVAKRTEALVAVVNRLEEEITERTRAEAALQQYTDRLHILQQIDRAILAAQSPATLAQVAVTHSPSLIPCQWAGMITFEPEVNEATVLAVNSERPSPIEAGERLSLDTFDEVNKLEGQLLVEDFTSETPRTILDGTLQNMGLASRILAPLVSRNKLLGYLELAAETPGIFSVEHSAVAEEVARQVALALENVRLHAETQRRTKGLAAINNAGRAMTSTLQLKTVLEQTMAEVRTLLEAEGASVLLYDPDLNDLVFSTVAAPDAELLTGLRLPLTEGIAGWVMEKNEPVMVDNVQTDPRFSDRIDNLTGSKTNSLVAVPLTYKDKVLGVVEVINRVGEKFRPQDMEMLQALTTSAAVAIENARLYKDLEDRMQDLQDAQRQLIQSEKMSALGRLVASITHEINNPLQSVQTCLTLTREEMEGDRRQDKIDRYLGIVESEIERVSTIIRRMRDFYRPGAHEGMQTVDVNETIASVLELTGKQLQHSEIVVEQSLGENLPQIEANVDHLKQVFLNLILNAVDAMPTGGTLQVTTRNTRLSLGPSRAIKPAVRLDFTDTGEGMSAETMSHLFEPFFTTKSEGSGLGLCISYSIIEAHHGQILPTSELGVGTTFSIILPTKQPV